MRWRFHELQGPEVVSRRDAKCKQIDDWWEAFAAKTDDLSAMFGGKADWDLPKWMRENLGAVDNCLCWEFGPAVHRSGHRLVITPESDRELRPMTQTILERAPELPGWEFYAYRLPEDAETASQMAEVRAGGDLADTMVRVAEGSEHRIDLTFGSPKTESAEDQQAMNRAFVAAETLLGEERLDKWIGVIEVARIPAQKKRGLLRRREPSGPEGFIPLAQLASAVAAAIAERRGTLPTSPHHAWVAETAWTLYELQPDAAEDYPGQRDLFVAKTGNEAIWQATHSGMNFFEDRFSTCGETICYVKTDDSEVLKEQRAARKHDLEDVLDALVPSADVGCLIGGGAGVRYSYFDLAVTDPEEAAKLVRDQLRAANVHKRSWILFCNADLCDEWIGIWDDTPAPPDG